MSAGTEAAERDDRAGPDTMADASSLCLSCGLCCNGVLFSHVNIEPDEARRLQGLAVDRVGERLKLRQPCPHHREGSCGIYAERFHKCKTFRCALLRRFEAGETGLAEARATVAQALRMIARVAGLDPASAQFGERARQRAAPPAGDGAGAALRRRVMIESLALDLFLDRKFRNRKAVEMESSRRNPDGA